MYGFTRPAALPRSEKVEPAAQRQRLRPPGRISNDKGQSLVEFALCLPILLLVVTGICTFGIFLNNYMMLTNAVSIGARTLAVNRGMTSDPCATTAAAVYAAAPTLTKSSFTFAFVLNGVAYTGTTCSSSSPTTGAAGNLVQNTPAQVTITYPCSLAVYGANYVPNCVLKSQITELVQ